MTVSAECLDEVCWKMDVNSANVLINSFSNFLYGLLSTLSNCMFCTSHIAAMWRITLFPENGKRDESFVNHNVVNLVEYPLDMLWINPIKIMKIIYLNLKCKTTTFLFFG